MNSNDSCLNVQRCDGGGVAPVRRPGPRNRGSDQVRSSIVFVPCEALPLSYSEIMIGFSGSITASPPWQMAELTLLTPARRWILTSRLPVTSAYMATIHLATWDLSNCMTTSLDDFMCSIHICYCCFCNCLWCSATAPSWQRARAHVGRHRAEESW